MPGRTWQRWGGQRLCLRGSDRGWVILRSNIRGVKANGGRGGWLGCVQVKLAERRSGLAYVKVSPIGQIRLYAAVTFCKAPYDCDLAPGSIVGSVRRKGLRGEIKGVYGHAEEGRGGNR